MRLATVHADGRVRVIAQSSATEDPRDVSEVVGEDIRNAFGLSAAQLHLADQPLIDLADVRWLPPVPHPERVLCAGVNFRTHVADAFRAGGEHPTLFSRFASSFVGHGDPVLTPPESASLDWEGEIVVVMGRAGRRIRAEEATDFVAGYSVMAENSVRAFQLHSSQATAGKNWDDSGSWGPWLITPDEVPDPDALELVTRVNGVEKQRGRLSGLIFDVPSLISYISTFTRLEPGDVIATGTPAGIGYREEPPRYLGPGDDLEIELVGYTVLRNHIMQDPIANG